MPRIKALLTIATTILAVTAGAHAQERPVGGWGVYIPGDALALTLADGRVLANGYSRAVLIEDDPTSPIHLVSQDCGGTNVMASNGTPIQIVGSCTAIDADGDLFHISYLNTPAAGNWQYTGGTGKFDGVTGGGTSEVVALGPDGRFTIRYEGTIRMR